MLTNRIVYKPDDPPAGDPPTNQQASPPPEPPAPQKPAWEIWLEQQPENVRQMYSEHTTGLTSALEKERKERKEHEKQLKRLADLEAEEQKRRDAAKTELEKALDAQKAAEEKAKQLELKELQRQAAEKHKLPVSLATRLQGETLEELENDAAELVKTLPKSNPLPPTNPGRNGEPPEEPEAAKKARLFGTAVDPFSTEFMKKLGGGVFFTDKE
ncbi:MAG: hypothetical protein LC124_00080 [Ignavibacteriales bacterium]|jgi:DNA polymerase III gamma/tau subunit|nr:hypothetical protein [Gammaproteobacteria bacterium]MCZ2267233.1 hypothetical protein [Ignavibacteriales bacterium]